METSNLKNVVMFTDSDSKVSRAPTSEAHAISITLAGASELVFDTSTLSKEVLHQAMLHGLKQKLVDSVAGKSGAEARDALKATADMLREGSWTRAREAGTGGSVTLLVEAMMKVFGKTQDECITVTDQHDTKELAKIPAVAAAILTIKAERAKAKADAAGKSASKSTLDSESLFS